MVKPVLPGGEVSAPSEPLDTPYGHAAPSHRRGGCAQQTFGHPPELSRAIPSNRRACPADLWVPSGVEPGYPTEGLGAVGKPLGTP